MKILFIHQNFPGQFKHLAPALAARGDEVIALSPQIKTAHLWQGVRMIPYRIARGSTRGMHPWVADLESKFIRAEACFNAALQLLAQGFEPDVIIAHFGWGESMFLKDVWPAARIGLFCEFFNRPDYPYAGFDPEFEHHPPLAQRTAAACAQFEFGYSPAPLRCRAQPDAVPSRLISVGVAR